MGLRWDRRVHGERLATALAACAVVILAGCSSPSTPSTPATTSAPSTTSAAPQVRPECAEVAKAASTAGNDLTAFLSGQGSIDQLRQSAQNLAAALGQARTALGADGSRLDAASTALQQLLTALQAQPVQPAAVRAAAQQVLSALGEVLSVCSTASATGAPSSGVPTPTS